MTQAQTTGSNDAAPDLAAKLDDLIAHIAGGRILEAMQTFYAPNTVMTEPAYGATEGLEANIEREKKFLASVKQWTGFEVTAKAVGDGVTVYECTMNWIDVNDQSVHVEQVAVQKWDNGRIVHERFYYAG